MPFRFVHTADIHLDSPLRSLALRDETLAELIGTATRTAFERTVSLCLEERVDALLIAGDLYDGAQTSMKTARFLAAQLGRLDAEGIRVFIARGNHDAESRITAELALPDSVTVFSGRAEAHTLPGAADGRDVVIHGISFRDPHAPDSLLPKFKAAVPDALNIGLLHTSLGGAVGHDPYAPCSLADLEATGFDYWALGHVHARAVHREAAPAIVMPGQPQGRDINEAGPKSVTLASLSGDGGVTLAEHVTAVAQFERVTVDAAGVEDWRDLVAAVGEALAAARSAAACKHLVARVRLRGPTPLAWRARVDSALLLGEAQARAERLGAVWVESVDNDTRPAAAPDTGAEADPVSELRALIHREVAPSPSFQAHAREIAEGLRGQLPRECAALLGEDEESFNAKVSGLIEEGARDVLAHLHGGARRDGEGGA